MKEPRTILIVSLLGLLHLFSLIYFTPKGMFYRGDGGLKYLLIQQMAQSSQIVTTLAEPQKTWVKEMHEAGFFPFQKPFVYAIDGKHHVSFPFSFPLISVIPYKLFGYWGLYLIPISAAFFMWLTMWQIINLISDDPRLATMNRLAICLFIFGMPLTFWGIAISESTLAMALLTFGLYGILRIYMSQNSKVPLHVVILSGMASGLAGWFRPEAIIVSGMLAAIFWLASLQKKLISIYTLSLLTSLILFFISNKLIYGHMLGIHASQVLDQKSFDDRLVQLSELMTALFWQTISYFPVLLLLPFSLIFISKKQWDQKPLLSLCLFMIMLGFPGICLILPHAGGIQFGPRFLQPLFIILLIFLLLLIKTIFENERSGKSPLGFARKGYFALLIIMSVICIAINVCGAYQHHLQIASDKRTFLDQLKPSEGQTNKHQVIVCNNPNTTQDMSYYLEDRLLFQSKPSQLPRLAKRLFEEGITQFTVISYHDVSMATKSTLDSIFYEEGELTTKEGEHSIFLSLISEKSSRPKHHRIFSASINKKKPRSKRY